MKKLELSAEEKTHLEALHVQTVAGKKRDRIKAVLLRSEDWTIPMIAQALRIHESTVARHISDYLAGKLSCANGGSLGKLDGKQTRELVAHLSEHTYHYTDEIIIHIKATYGVTYSVPGLNKWLHQQGFSYKKPKGQPHKAEQALQAEFMKQYEALKSNLQRKESIIFIDSVHPTQNTKISYGWLRKGEDKWIKTTASRTRVNLIGGIELNKLSAAVTELYDTINGASIADFFSKLRVAKKGYSTLHVILDQAGYHKSHVVIEAARVNNITLHYLPPYSPNLNPIERLWKVMNEHVRNNKFFSSAKEFRESIAGFFKNILPDIADSLSSRINDNFQILNHAS